MRSTDVVLWRQRELLGTSLIGVQLSSTLRSNADRLHSSHGGEGSAVVGVLDLIDWTMETAKELRTPTDSTTADLTTTASISGGEASLKSDDWLLMPGPGTELNTEQPVVEQPAGHASHEPPAHASEAPSVVEPEPVPPPQSSVPPPADVHAALLRAIIDPDIYTSKADRFRAIDLRWILRDIAADRLKSSPINKLDLQILIEMKLVELRSGVPHLTNTGVTAAI